jgi:hypothetical protein
MMKAYVAVTGAVFGLLGGAQAFHAFHDPEHLGEPAFLFHVIGALVLFLWAVRLLLVKTPR